MGRPDEEGRLQFGLNCVHLLRHSYGPADARCSVYIERYKRDEWEWLSSPTPVPLKLAAEILCVPEQQLIEEAKSGRRKYNYPTNVSRRVLVSGAKGPKWMKEREATKKLKLSLEQLREQIDTGKLEAQFLPEHMRIVLQTKWDYEQCPLFEAGGVCLHFQQHEGPQIRCLKEAYKQNPNPRSGLLF